MSQSVKVSVEILMSSEIILASSAELSRNHLSKHLPSLVLNWTCLCDSDPRLSFNVVERVRFAEAELATVSENVSVKSPRNTIREN